MPARSVFEEFTVEVEQQIKNPRRTDRWAVLVGRPEEPMHEYMTGLLTEYAAPERPRLRKVALSWPSDVVPDHAQRFLEENMVSSTPCLLLLRRGQLEAMISGAIPFDRLKGELDDLMSDRMQDRIEDAMAEIAEVERESWNGHLKPMHRTEAGYLDCSTCDGGGCPDCTDPA